MKVIIAGSRTITNYSFVKKTIEECLCVGEIQISQIDLVISGGAKGVDILGEKWAVENGIKGQLVIPDWERYGKSAGYRRNEEMADLAGKDGVLIAIWEGESRGTGHMIDIAKNRKLRVFIKKI